MKGARAGRSTPDRDGYVQRPRAGRGGHSEEPRVQCSQEGWQVRLEWWLRASSWGVKTFELHFEGLGGPGGFKQRKDKLQFAFEEEDSDCNWRQGALVGGCCSSPRWRPGLKEMRKMQNWWWFQGRESGLCLAQSWLWFQSPNMGQQGVSSVG